MGMPSDSAFPDCLSLGCLFPCAFAFTWHGDDEHHAQGKLNTLAFVEEPVLYNLLQVRL